MATRDRWVPLREAISLRGHPEVAASRAAYADQAQLASWEANTRYFVNDIYQVSATRMTDGWIWLNIRRRDGRVIFRDWRHFQRIKNEILGPECEAVELYPAESRLVDTSNKYVLVGNIDPAYRFPHPAWPERSVQDDEGAIAPGLKQRKL